MDLEKNNKTTQEKPVSEITSAHAWMERCGFDQDTLCSVIETLIFMSDKPLPLSKIKDLIDSEIPNETLNQAIERLDEGYQQNHHGIFIRKVAGGYQFCTRPNHAGFVQKLFKTTSLMLSPSALEVLAIIAYRQPISRVEIDRIRSVDSSHLVRGLMNKKLIRITGRSDKVGRPTLYGTTNEFLEVFSLDSLLDLPAERELIHLAKEDLGNTGDIKEVIATCEKKNFSFDELEEIDKLKGQIKNIAVDTDFTKDLHYEERKRRINKNDQESTLEQQTRSAFDIMEDHLNKTNEPKGLLSTKPNRILEKIEGNEMNELDKREHSMEKLQNEIADKAQDLQMDLDFHKNKEDDLE